VREEPLSLLSEHARVPIAFVVDRILDVDAVSGGIGGFRLRERALPSPFTKDYDAIAGEAPSRWADRFDVSNWGLIGAHADGARVGGAVVAFRTPGLQMLEGRSDVAVLWDVRVAPEWRRRGVGTRLFAATESWARERGCSRLKVETQNVNVAACRFYARQGCVLGAIDRFAYRDSPDEVQLLWHKDLDRSVTGHEAVDP
jgi:GNAT superfamily N-acetyltransferase